MKNFAVIGGGMIANFHAQAIQSMKNGSLIAIFARDKEKARQLGLRFNCKAYSDLGLMLADPEIDIVTIATPSGAHMEPALLAADAGKHIICEKPLEVTFERVQKMIDHCRSKKVMLSGIFNRRFNSSVALLKEAVDSGHFGKLTLCDAQIKWHRTQDYYDSGAWRGTWELDGGGALMNQAIHTIDLLQYLAGPVKRVMALTACLAHEKIEVEDTATALLEFENGALGTIQGATSCWPGQSAEVNLCGTKGSVSLADETFKFFEFQGRDMTSHTLDEEDLSESENLGASDPNSINSEGHRLNFEDVVDALEEGRAPLVSGEEAMKSVRLINAIYESSRNDGKWIIISN